jgi:hypothetical protein
LACFGRPTSNKLFYSIEKKNAVKASLLYIGPAD